MMLKEVPANCRHLEVVTPGFFFGDTSTIKWPGESWEDDRRLAEELRRSHPRVMGFRRFVSDPAEGKKYMDAGWTYVHGIRVPKEDVLDGTASQKFPGFYSSDIMQSNCRINGIDVLWMKTQGGRCWGLHAEDRVLTPDVAKGGAQC